MEVLTECERLDFSVDTVFSTEESETGSGEAKEGIGPKRCSKMAMMRNRDTRMAVATSPKETAFMGDTSSGGRPSPSMVTDGVVRFKLV